jgi:hypothetical protein
MVSCNDTAYSASIACWQARQRARMQNLRRSTYNMLVDQPSF